jgi:hypothetical protein
MLLSITLSNNQMLYQFLRATETPLAVVAEPNKLNELLTSYGLESLDLSEEDFQKEITFVKFLKDKYDDNFTETLYWDYRDELSATAQETILKEALQNDTSFENEATWYVQENMEWLPDYEKINEFYEQNPDLEEDDDFYLELFNDYIETDFNVETLLRNSTPDDITIYFGQSWDDDYHAIDERYNDNDTTVSTPIEWLIATQGYAPEDLANEETVLKSPFLTSLSEELYDYDTELDGMQLIAIPDSNDFEAILAVARKQGVIKASTTFGLFNRIHGGGSGLSIELEKDIRLDESAPIHDLTLAYRNNSYDYSPDAVYGLVRKKFTGEDLSEN